MKLGFVVKLTVYVSVAATMMGQSVSALGEQPVISHIKTGESSAATREFISFYNNSSTAIDVTGWCVTYSSASDQTKTTLACLAPPADDIKLMLRPFGYARFASQEFIGSVTDFTADKIFSAGLSGTAGHVRLIDSYKSEVDKVAWGSAVSPEQTSATAHSSGKVLQRKFVSGSNLLVDSGNNQSDFSEAALALIPASSIVEEKIIKDLCDNIEGLQTIVPDDYFASSPGQCFEDVCDNIPDLQTIVPLGYESLDGENCSFAIINLESSILQITEMLPNVTSYDTGKEYIEIYNPNNKQVDIEGYKLQLGPDNTKVYIFGSQILEPFTYYSYSDEITGIVLPNTSASLSLVAPSGNVVSNTGAYDNPNDDEAWALIDDVWQFTNRPTQNLPNLVSTQPDQEVEVVNLVPCGAGKIRNPETNRCKNIDTATGALQVCAANQERNPETNRCRNLTSANNLVACKVGLERNPATNRCRNLISTASSSLTPCGEGQERNPLTNRCKKSGSVLGANNSSAVVNDVPSSQKIGTNLVVIGVILLGVATYAGYEWRHEMIGFLRKIKISRS